MKYRTYVQYLIFGLSISATSVNAGSSLNFILEGQLSSTFQPSVELPTNSEAATCMQCHNGTNAEAIIIKDAETAMSFTSHGSTNHPVGMFYNTYVRRSPDDYVAATSLDPRIKLENGQVTCVSCHETKQTLLQKDVASLKERNSTINACSSKKTLTTGPGRTRLCLSCHTI